LHGGDEMNVYLEMPEDASLQLRARLGYAFRLFCAIYGHRPVLDGAGGTAKWDVAIRYRNAVAEAAIADARTVWLCRGLRERDPQQPAPPPVKHSRNGLSTVLHTAPERSKSPDWLGEIFEWVSCADEYSVQERDIFGRVPFEASYIGRHGLDATVPYAALAMRGLQQEICRVAPRVSEQPLAPEGIEGHAVIPTHDVDYFPQGRFHAICRLICNAASASMHEKRLRLAMRHAGQAMKMAVGANEDPLDQLGMLAEQEFRMGIASSYFFFARNTHRLDGGYALANASVTETMRWLKARGMEIGLNGSFTSLDEPQQLDEERNALAEQAIHAQGGRQHRLRFTFDRLLPAIENAGLEYDASIGWTTQIGFRAGACFAYPPYDFENEQAAGFLELPLVAVDEALRAPQGREGQLFHDIAQMIAASRRLGWGGISLLWRSTAFGRGWLPEEVGGIYWRLAEDRLRWNDAWMNASQFMTRSRYRYAEAGLLTADTPALVAQPLTLPIAVGQNVVVPAPAMANDVLSA
jgi:hypothetical protein